MPVGLLEEQAVEIKALKKDLVASTAKKERAESELGSREELAVSERESMAERESKHLLRIELLTKVGDACHVTCQNAF